MCWGPPVTTSPPLASMHGHVGQRIHWTWKVGQPWALQPTDRASAQPTVEVGSGPSPQEWEDAVW